MIFKPRKIPTYNTLTKEWSETSFLTRKEFSAFLDSKWKLPGSYGLRNTKLWRTAALKFQRDGKYCDSREETKDAKAYWAFEKKKIGQGIIVDDFYVPGAYYFYLNFVPIYDKVKGTNDFPEVWDGDLHTFLYIERALISDSDAVIVKARQKGMSLKLTSRLTRNLWFIANSVNKMVGFEDDYVNEKGSWKFVVTYRDFLNTHTPWYRDFEPDDSSGHWEQKKTIIEGIDNKKKKIEGLRSKLIAATAKKNPTKAVGGGIYELFCEEAGIFPNLDKVKEFAEAATKLGGVKTGFIVAAGSVGELKDCKPLESFALRPEENGFLGVEDTFSEVPRKDKIGFFFPDYWNYIGNDKDGNIVRCYDEDGNSNIELAIQLLDAEEDSMKDKETYTLWKSQHPRTLQDAFAIREENIWPTRIIKEHQNLIRQTYQPLCVDIIKDPSDKERLIHKISHWKPVNTLKVDPKLDNRGVVEIDELPPENPKWGLFYAGVDPIRNTNTVTSKSLMSVTIWKAAHINKKGQFVADYPVARYTGRFFSWEETYETCMNLIRYYNARVAVESNVTSFHEWAISKGWGRFFMHRKEIYILNEMIPNSTISNEIGVRMEGMLKEKALEFGIGYVDEILSNYSVINKEGEDETKFIYGVSRLRDIMLMEEMLNYNPKLNTDRIISFLLGLMACRSNTNRGLIITEDDYSYSKQHSQFVNGYVSEERNGKREERVRLNLPIRSTNTSIKNPLMRRLK